MKVGSIPILWSVIAITFIRSALGQAADEKLLNQVDDDSTSVPGPVLESDVDVKRDGTVGRDGTTAPTPPSAAVT